MELLIICMKRRFSMLCSLCTTLSCCLTSMLETNESQLILLNFFFELISKSTSNYTKHYATCTEQYNIFRFVTFNICCQYSKKKNPSLFFMARIIYQAMDMLIAICVYNILVTRAPCTLYVQNNLCVKGRKNVW